MTKKKKKRSNLVPSDNTKVRQIYADSHYYSDKLPESAKEWLEKFTGEYYGASFENSWEYDEIHELKVDRDTVEDLNKQLKAAKNELRKICNKSPNTTTEGDRKAARLLQEHIDAIDEFLNEVHPRRGIEQANYRRNNDLLNHARVSNEFRIASWEDLREDELNSVGEWEDDDE